jgi:hypothetical protein
LALIRFLINCVNRVTMCGLSTFVSIKIYLTFMSMVPYPKNQESGRGWNLTLVETRVLTYYIEFT